MKNEITHNNQIYLIKCKPTNEHSLKRISVVVFKKGEKLPLFGTIFSKSTSEDEIQNWIITNIKQSTT